MKALVILATDWAELVDMPDADDGGRLDWLQSTVGGYIEGISPRVNQIPDPWIGYCDEEGKRKGKLINAVATKLARLAGWPTGDVLCGTVVFTGVGQEDETDVPDSLIELGRQHQLWIE